ncbi:hypothetical protein ACFL6P_05785 [Candidatus Latescibacterota bacterium]
MTTEERLKKLEQEITRTKRNSRLIALLFVGLSLSWWFFSGVNSAAQQGVVDEIRTRKITVIDDDGKSRIELSANEEIANIAMLDKNGAPRISLITPSTNEVAVGIIIANENRLHRLILMANEHEGRFMMFDNNQMQRVVLACLDDKMTGLSLSDKNEMVRVSVVSEIMGKTLPSVMIMDENMTPTWSTP